MGFVVVTKTVGCGAGLPKKTLPAGKDPSSIFFSGPWFVH
jgi:hypothetical protein